MMLLVKSILFLLISLLFISRLVAKYAEYSELGYTNILGVVWQGNFALIALGGVAILTIILMFMAARDIYRFFTKNKTAAID